GVTGKYKSIEFRRPRSSNGDRGRFCFKSAAPAAGEIMKKLFIAILIGFAFVPAAQTQTVDTEISGHVKDPQGANLPGATVRLFGRDRTFSLVTTTDSTGAYNFKHLATGEYLIEAEASGFALATAQLIAAARGQTTTLDIALQL